MASKAVTEENNARTCSICIECFKQPKLLPCFHTFCLGCLEQYTSKKAVDGKFPCPVCRFEVTLPQSGVKGFQTNFYIEAQSTKEEHAGGLCEVCSQTALNRCKECEQLLCEHCTNVHSSLKSTRSHTLIRLEETSREKPILFKPEFCPKHKGELFRFHCQKCERAICRDCKLTSHESHPTVDLEDVIEEGRDKLWKVKVEFEELDAAFDRKLHENTTDQYIIKKSVQDIENSINRKADDLISQINVVRKRKLKQVTALKESELDRLVKIETRFNQEKKFLKSHIGHVTTLLTDGCGADVLNSLPDMNRRLNEIKSEIIAADLKPTSPLLHVYYPKEVSFMKMFNNQIGVFKTPSPQSFNFVATTQGRAIDFLCPTSNDQVWVGIRAPMGKCSVVLFDYQGVAIKGFHVTKGCYDSTRLKGIAEMFNKLDGANASKEIQTFKADIKSKCKPYSDTNKDGKTCSVDIKKRVVVITSAKGVKELELSSHEVTCAEDFAPRDVCWSPDGRIVIADGGSKSVIVFTLNTSQPIGVRGKWGHFEPYVVASTSKYLLVGVAAGYVYGIPCNDIL